MPTFQIKSITMNQPTIVELAKMIDHSLLHPTMTDDDLKQGCETAIQYGTASVCIKPYGVSKAAKWLARTGVITGTVIGFPHGNSTTEIKVQECRQACEDGAAEIDMVVNIGKVLSKEWNYVQDEIAAINQETLSQGGILKVIFENDFLPEDEFKIRLCEICNGVRVAYVKTSTGYGFVRGADGRFSAKGATEEDLRLMRKYAAPYVKVKAAGGVRTLDDMLKVKELGVSRVGATATAAILEEARKRFEGSEQTAKVVNTLSNKDSGY
jgi:deoxyribose-phosphate aldolase